MVLLYAIEWLNTTKLKTATTQENPKKAAAAVVVQQKSNESPIFMLVFIVYTFILDAQERNTYMSITLYTLQRFGRHSVLCNKRIHNSVRSLHRPFNR